MRLSLLTVVEAFALVGFLVLAVGVVARPEDRTLVPLNACALVEEAGTQEWLGIYFEDQKVGYAMQATSNTRDGGQLMQSSSLFTMALFGQITDVVTSGTALLDAEGRLKRFDFFTTSGPVRLVAQGELLDDELVVQVIQAGEVQELRLPMAEPPQLGLTIHGWLRSQPDLHVGRTFTLPYFDPLTLTQQTMRMEITGVEILPNDEEAWWVEREVAGIRTRSLISPKEGLLRDETGAVGFSLVRETREEAVRMPKDAPPVDLIAKTAVRVRGRMPSEPRRVSSMTVEVLELAADQVPSSPPRQVREGARVRVEKEVLPASLELAVAESDPSLGPYLAESTFLPVRHREIVDAAQAIVGTTTSRLQAVRQLNTWVYDTLRKVPTVGVPNALEVLRVGQGDCNEHTALMVALSRAAGIPARTVAGVVFSDRVGDSPGFYYHAWPEIWLGPEVGWVAVDPTFGQVPADATHIKLVEGELDRQIELLGMIGRLGLEIVDVDSAGGGSP